jgi:hypothetical protein
MSDSLWVPWRSVVSVETPEDKVADYVLHLECGHTETWPRFTNTPTTTKCTACDQDVRVRNPDGRS